MRQIHFVPGGVVKIGRFVRGHIAFIEGPTGIQDDFVRTAPKQTEA